jgi:hypothetical protein
MWFGFGLGLGLGLGFGLGLGLAAIPPVTRKVGTRALAPSRAAWLGLALGLG